MLSPLPRRRTTQSVFAANVAKIEKHNAEAAAGLHTFTMGVNKFADMLPEE